MHKLQTLLSVTAGVIQILQACITPGLSVLELWPAFWPAIAFDRDSSSSRISSNKEGTRREAGCKYAPGLSAVDAWPAFCPVTLLAGTAAMAAPAEGRLCLGISCQTRMPDLGGCWNSLLGKCRGRRLLLSSFTCCLQSAPALSARHTTPSQDLWQQPTWHSPPQAQDSQLYTDRSQA